MENLDIEKLDRKTPYILPENAFLDMQKNVFNKVIIKKETPVYNLKWFYAAAAVILLVISSVFLFKYEGNAKNGESSISVADNGVEVPKTDKGEVLADDNTNQEFEDVPKSDLANISSSDLTSRSVNNQTNVTVARKTVNYASYKKPALPESKVDEVLDGFSSAEIASLSNNSEQDVYLDLYN